MIFKAFSDIGKADIEGLVANRTSEGKHLEYKECLDLDKDSDKKELCADISSFANAGGGDIIYGIKEKRENNKPTGLPEAVLGIDKANIGAEILRIDQVIKAGIEPRIPSVQIVSIEGFPKGPVLVVRIGKSWISPHMIRESGRFFSRTSQGKYPLDVVEIRSAFADGGQTEKRIKDFVNERIAKVIANETPVSLNDGAQVLLHMIPLSAFREKRDCFHLASKLQIRPMHADYGFTPRINLDGVLSFQNAGDEKAFGYTQVYRNGIIETIDSMLLNTNAKLIPRSHVEKEIVKTFTEYLPMIDQLELDYPLVCILTLIGVRGFTFSLRPRAYLRDKHEIDRDVVIAPDVVLNERPAKPASSLKPIFDAIWQAAGFPKSPNYNEKGEWAPEPAS